MSATLVVYYCSYKIRKPLEKNKYCRLVVYYIFKRRISYYYFHSIKKTHNSEVFFFFFFLTFGDNSEIGRQYMASSWKEYTGMWRAYTNFLYKIKLCITFLVKTIFSCCLKINTNVHVVFFLVVLICLSSSVLI